MSKGILGPTVVTLCLGCIGGFHCLKSMKRSSYDDASKNVGELLKKENFVLATFEDGQDEEYWGKIIAAYNAAGDDERFEDLPKNDTDFKSKIKRKCEEVIGKPTKSLSSYNKARRWCVIPQTTTERLKLHGRLALDPTKGKNDEAWTSMAEQYLGKEIKSLKITPTTKTEEIVTIFQKECNPLTGIQNWDKNFDSSFEKMKRYCSVRE